MKTLIIHPADSSTDFLKESYSGKDYTVVTDCNISKKLLKDLIKSHDKIVMMGHGTALGLIAGVGSKSKYLIDSNWVYLLKDKECICIWCYAYDFFSKYKLKGYATGMIISELDEGYHFGIYCGSSEINHSNSLFAKSLGGALDSSCVGSYLKESYCGVSELINFNVGNL